MRRPPIPTAKTCKQRGCGVVFMGVAQQKSCDACRQANKKASDRAHTARHKAFEHRDHLTPAQVEQVFQQALAQIRRERRYTGELSSSHNWKYQEPGR